MPAASSRAASITTSNRRRRSSSSSSAPSSTSSTAPPPRPRRRHVPRVPGTMSRSRSWSSGRRSPGVAWKIGPPSSSRSTTLRVFSETSSPTWRRGTRRHRGLHAGVPPARPRRGRGAARHRPHSAGRQVVSEHAAHRSRRLAHELRCGGGPELRLRISLRGLAVRTPSDAALDRSAAIRAVQSVITGWAEEFDDDDRTGHLRAVARKEFGRRGYEATTMRDIAAAAGLSSRHRLPCLCVQGRFALLYHALVFGEGD